MWARHRRLLFSCLLVGCRIYLEAELNFAALGFAIYSLVSDFANSLFLESFRTRQDNDKIISEIISQGSGAFISMDSTFKVAGRVQSEASAIFFVMGEDGKIHAYGGIQTESAAEILPLLRGCVSYYVLLPQDIDLTFGKGR